MVDIEDLLLTYKETKKEWVLSEKQKDFIYKLAKRDDIFGYISELLGKEISNWESLSCSEVRILISKLINRQPATTQQIALIKSLFSLEEIHDRFNSSIHEYEDLNNYHVKRLLAKPHKFNLNPKDHPIESTIDYEYGYQESSLCQDNKMYYLKFYDFMMLDYDNITYDELIQILEPYAKSYLFAIYQTHNGYHVFLMSALYNHRTHNSTKLMTLFKCDYFYIMFSFKNGYKIRLSPKIGRNEECIFKFLTLYGNSELKNEKCDELCKIHDTYINFNHL